MPHYWFKWQESTACCTGRLSFVMVSPWHLDEHFNPFCRVTAGKLGHSSETTMRKLRGSAHVGRGQKESRVTQFLAVLDINTWLPVDYCPPQLMIKDSQKQTTAPGKMERHTGRNVEWRRGCVKKKGFRERKICKSEPTQAYMCRGR